MSVTPSRPSMIRPMAPWSIPVSWGSIRRRACIRRWRRETTYSRESMTRWRIARARRQALSECRKRQGGWHVQKGVPLRDSLLRQVVLLYPCQRPVTAKRFNRLAQVVDLFGGTLLRAGAIEIHRAQGGAHQQLAAGDRGPDVLALGDTVEPGIDAAFQKHLRGIFPNGQGVDLLVAETLGTQDFLLRTAQAYADHMVDFPGFGEAAHPVLEAEKSAVHAHDGRDPGEVLLTFWRT